MQPATPGTGASPADVSGLATTVASRQGIDRGRPEWASQEPRGTQYERRGNAEAAGERRNVEMQEAVGGHTIERHVGKSENWLRRRLGRESNLKFASSFSNEQVANRVQGRFVNRYRAEIDTWLRSGEKRLSADLDMGEPIGIVLERGTNRAVETTKARVVLVRDNSPQGWYFRTSMPIK